MLLSLGLYGLLTHCSFYDSSPLRRPLRKKINLGSPYNFLQTFSLSTHLRLEGKYIPDILGHIWIKCPEFWLIVQNKKFSFRFTVITTLQHLVSIAHQWHFCLNQDNRMGLWYHIACVLMTGIFHVKIWGMYLCSLSYVFLSFVHIVCIIIIII